MKSWQTLVRYGAIALALILIVNIAVWGLRIFGVVFGLASLGTYDEAKVYSFAPESIETLDIDISAAQFTLTSDPCDEIIVKSNLKNLTVKETRGTLRIKEKHGVLTVTDTEAYVEIFYPLGFEFDNVDIDGGAGKLVISRLTAQTLDLDLGAGDTSFDDLTVTKEAEIDGGAGALSFSRSDLTNLDIDMGVGRLSFAGIMNGKNQISLGVGEAVIDLYDDAERYYFDVEKGIGEIEYHGTDDGNFKRENQETSVKIEGGIGKIVIKFG
ncbi:MAG: DUF4097 family beta strand repeat protein [Clostridia bacterium]|nr:DUF4097 family beta strand repeat protein [Clostridia bacterium]